LVLPPALPLPPFWRFSEPNADGLTTLAGVSQQFLTVNIGEFLMKLSLPEQVASQAEFIVNNLQQTDYQHTDHLDVLFAAETPVVDDSGNFSVRVYDSAAEPHFDDTRGDGESKFESGVGSGFINFLVDDLGRPTAFQFVPSDGFETLPIAIGRVEPV
jgi:hypothetical protein